jgi:threonine dehydratase
MVSLQDIRAAREAIRDQIINTPCLYSRTLSDITGAEVYLKFENHQFTASFKERGALNKLLSLSDDEKRAGVAAASAGNHAQGVAYNAGRLGIRSVIVMPKHTPNVKVEQTRKLGAEVVLFGETFDDARARCAELVEEQGLTLVHPYDDAQVIAGQGTIALEMLESTTALDTLIIAVGGGGLISGMATAAKALQPTIELIGVETERFPSMRAAIRGEKAVFGTSTIADGIAVKTPGKLPQEIIKRLVKDIVLVDESDLEHAIVLLLEIEKTVVEGAGAAGLAALLRYPDQFKGKRVGLVLCGGNIDPLVLAGIIERGMVKSGRLSRLSVVVRDVPGALAKITSIIAANEASIDEVHHQRAFSNLSVQEAAIEFVLKTRGREHIQQIIDALANEGFNATV